jgi:Ala-tRNA(Pro) deacylase
MNQQEKVYRYLEQLEIPYEISTHLPLFTIDALDGFEIPNKQAVAKNLFLRNDNGKEHYLIVLQQDKQADLKDLRVKIGSSRLSFASEERLMKHLGLTKGSVSPFGIINNKDAKVHVIFDSDLAGEEILGFHPNENIATVWISYKNIKKVIEHNGNPMTLVRI